MLKNLIKSAVIVLPIATTSLSAFSFGDAINAINVVSDIAKEQQVEQERKERAERERVAREKAEAERIRAEKERLAKIEKEKAENLALAKSKGFNSYEEYQEAEAKKAREERIKSLGKAKTFDLTYNNTFKTQTIMKMLPDDTDFMRKFKQESNQKIKTQNEKVSVEYNNGVLKIVEYDKRTNQLYRFAVSDIKSIEVQPHYVGDMTETGNITMKYHSPNHWMIITTKPDKIDWQTGYNGRTYFVDGKTTAKNSFQMMGFDSMDKLNELKTILLMKNKNIKVTTK